MDARQWLGLEPTHNPNRWYLPVVPGISTGGGFLFGGCGLGAAIAALEGTTGRPVVWATAQYLSFARPGSIMDIDVTVAVAGKHTTQARAVAHVGGTEILTVNAALGERDFPEAGQWSDCPSVPAPDQCPPRESRWNVGDSILSRLDQRWALPGGDGSGRCAVWTRMPDLLNVSAPALAVLGDYVPLGLTATLTHEVMSNSLDNTLRVAEIVPTEWVLLDIRVDVVAHGFGHGQVHLWAEDGTLMATASQSALIRLWAGER
jgi:acyl-CoA thioesterase